MMSSVLKWVGLALLASAVSVHGPSTKAGAFALVHVTVIDVTGGPLQSQMTALIAGGRVAALGRDGTVPLTKATAQVDASGKFLIPGLWDMHVHLEDRDFFFPLFVANGVTSVRDMGVSREAFDALKQLRAGIEAGQLLGPRVFTPGPMLDGPRSSPDNIRTMVKTAAEARQAVRSAKAHGADFIKVHGFIPRDAYFALADEARQQGLTFAGHVPVSITVAEAIEVGQKSIEHNLGLPLATSSREAVLRKPVEESFARGDEWTPSMRAANLASQSHDEHKAATLFASMVQHDVSACPTLIVMKHFDSTAEFLKHVLLKYYPRAEANALWKTLSPIRRRKAPNKTS